MQQQYPFPLSGIGVTMELEMYPTHTQLYSYAKRKYIYILKEIL